MAKSIGLWKELRKEDNTKLYNLLDIQGSKVIKLKKGYTIKASRIGNSRMVSATLTTPTGGRSRIFSLVS